MKKILLPTDFSDNSWNAISYALKLFKDETCVFYLLNTYTPIIHDVEYFQLSNTQFELADALKEESQTGLEEIKNRIETEFKNPKHTFTLISSFNNLIKEIEELHKGNVMDFIVMGTKGATGAKKILFGTNTVHVINNVKCPVLAIPENYVFETPHEILFPSDYGVDFQDKHLQPIMDIASFHNARVNILHATYGYNLSEEQERNKQKLEIYFKQITHLFHSISNQNVQEAITSFQLKSRINMLVMINNKHSFFENLFFRSTIKQIGFHLSIPFLVIPSKTLK